MKQTVMSHVSVSSSFGLRLYMISYFNDPLLFKTCMAKDDMACTCDGIFVPGQVDPVCVRLWLAVGWTDGSTGT